MRVQPITTAAEALAEQILRRFLAGTGWTVALKLPIQVVLDKETARLTPEEFSLYTRGHFDFTVYREADHEPQFVIEFDWFGHGRARQVDRDIIKNRLCAAAGLPLLRIGLEHIAPKDRVSILEWIVQLFLAFEHELDELELNADEERPSDIGDEPKDEDSDYEYVPGEDGGVFESEHPFPGNAAVARRLLSRFGISVERFLSSSETALYLFEIDWPGKQPTPFEEGGVSEFVVSERPFRVYPRTSPSQTLLESVGRARFAWAHRTEFGKPGGRSATAAPQPRQAEREPDRGLAAIDGLWFDPWGVAAELALYNALSQVERWASEVFPPAVRHQ